jgi:hypothetical protein
MIVSNAAVQSRTRRAAGPAMADSSIVRLHFAIHSSLKLRTDEPEQAEEANWNAIIGLVGDMD